MSGKTGKRYFWVAYGLSTLLLSFGSNLATAWDLPQRMEDPLFTRPPVLDRGAILPGDHQVVVCSGNEPLNHPLTLSDAVDLALCRNPQVHAAWAAIKVQAGAVGEARAAYLPTATATLSQLHTRTEFPGVPEANSSVNGHTIYGGLTWRIFDFGAREGNNEAARLLLVAAMLAHDAALQKTLSNVVSAYFEATSARAAFGARTESRQLADDALAATVRRERRGAAGQSDTLQASTATAKAQLAEQRAAADYNKSLAMLAYAIGLSGGAFVELADMPEDEPGNAVGDLKGWLDEAMARHPAIAAARAQLEAAQAKVRQVRGEGRPTVDLTGNIYQNGYPNQGLQRTRSTVTTVGISLTIPLFEGFARTYKVVGANAEVDQRAAQFEDTEHQVLTDVVKTHADATSALANLTASERLLNSARSAVRSSENRYAKGAADVLELLSTQSALSDALQERVRCLSEWRSTRLRLMASAGVLAGDQIHAIANR
ncbi:TolC family protein [Cupriavidus sp. D384]|uniref:TolC family protein n=1 Tax=Cupriavidus sp. D384 TaxID=1538095 RepID=UPI000B271D25|nr:TolC family protein [Cupriavidus sp. D384]